MQQQSEQIEKHKLPVDYDIYLFINTKSGGKAGGRFMELQMQTVRFNLMGHRIDVSFFDLLNDESKNEGLKKLRDANQAGMHCIVIVCGGDGTVMWVVEQIVKMKINIHDIPVGIIPIGTGNDFSRALGWGGKQQTLIGEKFDKLKALVLQWIQAETVDFDVWEIELTLNQNGRFKKMKDKQSVVMEDVKVFRRSFTNYCSIGIDGRIGYSFDRHRSNSRIINQFLYAAIGLSKFCDTAFKMHNLVSKMQRLKNQFHMVTLEMLQVVYDEMAGLKKYQSNFQPSVQARQIIFDNGQIDSPLKLKGNYENILALNINSLMGGVTNMWNTSAVAVTNTSSDNFFPQSFNDGVLQFLSWKNQLGLALERIVSMGSKVAQGQGPFIFTFFKSYHNQFHTFLQIDGEFFKVLHPKQMIFRRCQSVPRGFIRVLKNRGRPQN